MRYPAIKVSDARMYLIARREQREASLESITHQRGDGSEVDLAFAPDLRAELGKLKKRFPATLKKGGEEAAEFEAKASEVVHKAIPSDTNIIADGEFWIWLALTHFN